MGLRRYTGGARFYDVLSGEHLIYRSGRVAGVAMMNLAPGDTVLDLGCGTGLNLPLLVEAVGPSGHVIGLDRSCAMLAVAARRVARHHWTTVTLIHADATDFTADDLAAEVAVGDALPVDAILSTYAMSVFRDWRTAWECAHAVLKPGGRACIVDMQVPTGRAAALSPIARLACAAGGSNINAHPWTIIEELGTDVIRQHLRGGHIQVAAASIP